MNLSKKIVLIFLNLILLLILFLMIVPSPFFHYKPQHSVLICSIMKGSAQALEFFKKDNINYPTTEEGLHSLLSNPNRIKYPNYNKSGYLYKMPRDSWGANLIYKKNKDSFELISYGADKRKGGDDEYKDIFYKNCEE